jgi:hypothetical protein
MNPKDLDRELARLLTEQRLADEASAPGFQELMARARARTGGRALAPQAREGRWAWRAAVAAAASLALALGLSLLRPPPGPRPPSQASTLAAWKAPSDILLQTPGAELMGGLPVLLPSVPAFDADEGAPRQRAATPRSTQTKVPQTKAKGVES